MKLEFFENTYKLIENNGDCFDKDEFAEKSTDYFKDYDYIVGDFSYGKLRLKGFCKKNNKLYKPINNFETFKKYLKENCTYGCKYFVLEKEKIAENH